MIARPFQAAPPPARWRLVTPERLTLAAFVLFVLLSSGASVAIRFTYAELPAFWSAAARFGGGALVMWALLLARRVPLPRGGALIGAALFGALGLGAGPALMYWGLTRTPASLYQVLSAVMPLLTLMFTLLHGQERPRARALLGALLAAGGIAVALGGSAHAAPPWPHVLAVLAGFACAAESGVLVKRFGWAHPVGTSAVAMTVGAALLACVSLLAGERWALPSGLPTWLAFGYLVLGVTAGGFLLYLFVLGRWAASAASYAFVLVPLVTVVLASRLAGEHVTWSSSRAAPSC